jgi:diguanylate cyclase (GGDEF)-like protein
MKVTHAAVLEPRASERRKLVEGLKKAGLKVSAALAPHELGREQLVVLGPTRPREQAALVRRHCPDALLLAAIRPGAKASFADALLPLPISPKDLKVRLPELLRLKHAEALAARATPAEPIVDPFTGFHTFAYFKEVVFVEVKRARRYGFPVAMALVAFDPLGVAMSEALRPQLFGGLALSIRRSLRDTDYAVQYSQDRVLLLMPHTDLPGALVVSRRICERVAKATLAYRGRELHPTISVGVAGASTRGGEFSFSDIAHRAQVALEEALARGGNRVEFGSVLDAPAGAAEGSTQ